MSDNLCYAYTDTPTPGQAWCKLTEVERLALIKETVSEKEDSWGKILVIVDSKIDGQVIVSLLEPVPADKRGTLLLDLESFLQQTIDPGLVVWLEPLGDRNSLRNLRGIEVKG